MNRFETNKKTFWLLPISIILGIGCCYFGVNDFDLNFQSFALIIVGIIMTVVIPTYAIFYQKVIEINQSDKTLDISYPMIKKRICLKYEQVEKIRILKDVYASQGMYYDEITIFSKKHKVRMKSNEISCFKSLENKLKYELKEKIEIIK